MIAHSVGKQVRTAPANSNPTLTAPEFIASQQSRLAARAARVTLAAMLPCGKPTQ
jgi:hypothetical protein